MKNFKYLIVGGGMTAASAVEGIREIDSEGSIGLFSTEPDAPYDRPSLSKALWKGDDPSTVWRNVDPSVELHLATKIERLDPASKTVTDDKGQSYAYEKLLIATGVSPRRLGGDDEGVIYYRTFADFKRLQNLAQSANRFLVVGGGFIGSEIAAGLNLNGKQVTLAFPAKGVCANLFPADLSANLNDYYREKGVDVRSETRVTDIRREDGKFAANLNGKEAKFDAVVVGVGTELNLDLAKQAGLGIENGIRVDAQLKTSQPDIYAAGDVANFFDPVLQEWRRVEHEDNANSMGKFAGRSMAGFLASYDHSPFFYSDLFDLGYEAVGSIDSRLQTVSDWKEPYREGVVYYVGDSRVRGVLLWNVWEKTGEALDLIAQTDPFSAEQLQGKIKS